MPWDWLYGPGYWWFSGGLRHGIPAGRAGVAWHRSPWWFWQQLQRSAGGRRRTRGRARRRRHVGSRDRHRHRPSSFHPDQDHSYQIQAEVVDQSRRTIVGTGGCWSRASRSRFTFGPTAATIAWATRSSSALPRARSTRIAGRRQGNAPPAEDSIRRWPSPSKPKSAVGSCPAGRHGSGGTADQGLRGRTISPVVRTDRQQGARIEGGQVITVAGEGFDGSEFASTIWKSSPTAASIKPATRSKLQINTNRTGAAVLLFLRPSNGIYLEPRS